MDKMLKLQMVFSALDKASAPMKAVAASSSKMGMELKKSRDALEALQKQQSNLTGFNKMQRELTETGSALEGAQLKLSLMRREIDQTDSPTKEMTRAFAAAEKEVGQLGQQFQNQQSKVSALERELSRAGFNTADLSEDQRKLKADLTAASKAVEAQTSALADLDKQQSALDAGRAQMEATQQTGDKLMGGGAKALTAGAAVAAPIVYATKEAANFQAAMVDVKKVLNDVTPASMKALENGLLDMSGRIPVPVEGLGQIAAEAARAGIAAKDLLPFTENAAKMAAAFDISAEASGAMMANWSKGLSLTIPQTVELGDKVNALTNAFGGSAAEVADMVTQVGPLGKVSGVASGEMAAMATLMNSIGIDSRVGATGIKNFMLTMSAGEGATKAQAAAMEKLGLNSVDMAKRMQTDARGAILSVLDAINQLPKEQQAGLLTNLFGRESVAAIAPMLSNLDQLKKNFNLVGDSSRVAGSMNREFAAAMEKTNNKTGLAKNSLSGMAISFGDKLLPMVDSAADKISKVANAIGGWAREHPALAQGIGVVLVVLAGLLIGAGSLAIAIGALLGPFAALRFALLFAGPMLKGSMAVKLLAGAFNILKAAVLANPLIAAAAAIALAAYLIYDNWDTLVPYFTAIWDGIKAIFGPVITLLKAIFFTFTPAGLIYKHWDTLKPYFMAIWDGIKAVFGVAIDLAKGFLLNFTPAGLIYKHWDTLAPYFTAIWDGITSLFSDAWSIIESAAEGNFNPTNMIIAKWDGITEYFSNLWASVQEYFSIGWEAIKSLFLNYTPQGLIYKHWDKITNYFSNLWGRVKTTFSSRWDSIKSMMSGWFTSMSTIGSKMISNLVAGIKSAPGAVLNALKGLVSGAMSAAANMLGFNFGGGGAGPPKGPPKHPAVAKLAGARAAGGPVAAGKMYLVGEEGPEYFIPPGNGSILSNRKSAALAGLGAAGMALSLSAPLAAQDSFGSAINAGTRGNALPAQSGPSEYVFNFNITGGGDARQTAADVAKAVEEAIRKIEREKASARRSEYRDDD